MLLIVTARVKTQGRTTPLERRPQREVTCCLQHLHNSFRVEGNLSWWNDGCFRQFNYSVPGHAILKFKPKHFAAVSNTSLLFLMTLTKNYKLKIQFIENDEKCIIMSKNSKMWKCLSWSLQWAEAEGQLALQMSLGVPCSSMLGTVGQ